MEECVYIYALEYPKGNVRHILQCDLNGNVIREWQSVSVARNTLGLHRQPISRCLEGRQADAYGFIWRYKNAM